MNGDTSFYLANYSPSSLKLLEKIIILSATLEKRAITKLPTVNFDSWRKRRLMLFSALTIISNKFGLGSKLLQLDWLVELLSRIICKIRLELAAKIVKIEGGLKRLWNDLELARKLQILQIFRAALRKEKVLKQKLIIGEAQNFLSTIERRKNQNQTKLVQNNPKLEAEIANLHLEDPNQPCDTLKKFIHIWRCILNLRLVKSRTRKRVKTSVISRWRRSTRVSTIAGIYNGKKIKLRAMNQWFFKSFGRTREHKLTLRLNDFVARKRRRSMFLTRDEVNKSHALTAKGLFSIWRNKLEEKKSKIYYESRLLKRTFKRLNGYLSLTQGKAQTSRLYNEIRLLKNFFYNWFSSVIPDRFVFARDRMLLIKNEGKLKLETIQKWILKSRSISLIEHQCNQLEISFRNRQKVRSISNWNLLTKQHSARLIWTGNFRVTEDLRRTFTDWRVQAKNQIISDTKYQFNICKSSLKIWRKSFDEKQEKRFQLKNYFKLWKSFSIGKRGIRFIFGQKLIRKLTKLKVSNSILSKVLEHSNEEGKFEEYSEYSKKSIAYFNWKNRIKQVKILEDFGNVFLLEKIKKVLQIWRLRNSELNVIESEPFRMKSKIFGILKKASKQKKEKSESLDGQLFHYYTNRAIQLEGRYFHRWESAFQVTQVGEHCCLQVLKLWESQKRTDLFKRWQVQTAGIIFEKCKRITNQQGVFTRWRRSCAAERDRRSLRIVSKYFQDWRKCHHQRKLETRETQFRHVKQKLKHFSQWKNVKQELLKSWSRANDFFYIVRGSRSLDIWKQKLESLRTARMKTQTLLLLRAPIARKPRIEQILANAASLSDLNLKLKRDENCHLIMENLNIAELSV